MIVTTVVVRGNSYLSPCREASKPSFVHASCKTSARCLAGVIFMTARRADESMTTTWEAIQRRLKPSGTSGPAEDGALSCWVVKPLVK